MGEPAEIKKLDECVVNRIAAGEIIQRPANALKEMIENSLDAKSTNIQITVKSGGLKYLQIQDNGTGIRKDNMDIVCERFTTSKLTNFEDLSSMSTYGFRGEALASISHVAHLTIQTKTRNEKCAYRAAYQDGKLKGGLKTCAGNQGTQITVEDLFYNVPQRKQVLKSVNEEHQKIHEVVCKYAVHNWRVGFVLKKFGESNSVRTTPSTSPIDNIRIIYGTELAKNLFHIEHKDDHFKFSVNMYLTNVNFSMKKSIYLFFINHRLVESVALKSGLDEIYATYLGKGNHPFVYASLELDPMNVDVNVHPTKHEVHFMHEDEIIEQIKGLVERKLMGGNEVRTFYTQSKLPGAEIFEDKRETSEETNPSKDDKVYAKDLVRTDSKIQKIDKFFGGLSQSQMVVANDPEPSSSKICKDKSRKSKKNRIETKLTSVLNLQKAFDVNHHKGLRRSLSHLTFVGVVDRKWALIQTDTTLFLCDTQPLAEELFYQIILNDFGNFETIPFDGEGLSICRLARIYMDCEDSEWVEEDGDKDELSEKVQEILVGKRMILKEYFGLNISEAGMIETIPQLLEKHVPVMAYLPRYIVRLATDVTWETESECFQTFSRETAHFYSQIPYSTTTKEWNWTVEHVIYPAIRQNLLPPPSFAVNKALLQLATLPNLYKVFERC